MKLCSACLLGINCRYNGETKPNKKVLEFAKKETLIPVCPEQLGGLTTPRPVAQIRNEQVVTKSGNDVTKIFQNGAKEVLKIARLYKITEAIFKQRSPSCGSGQIYDGTFSRKVVKGDGITTKLLKENNIAVHSEE